MIEINDIGNKSHYMIFTLNVKLICFLKLIEIDILPHQQMLMWSKIVEPAYVVQYYEVN